MGLRVADGDIALNKMYSLFIYLFFILGQGARGADFYTS